MRRVEEKAKAAGFRTSDPHVQAQMAHEVAEVSETTRADRARASELFKDAGVPLRQASMPERERKGLAESPFKGAEWVARQEEMAARIGSGFLIAFIGDRGTGKTQMAVELIRLATSALMSAKYSTAMEFFINVKGAYRDDSGTPSEAIVVGQYTKPRLLVLDEIQERGATQWENRLLTHLVDVRYREMRDTVLIGNLAKDELEAELGKSISSRLAETGGVLTFGWPSFRQPGAVANKGRRR